MSTNQGLSIELNILENIQGELVIEITVDGRRIIRLSISEFLELKRIINAVQIGRIK